MAWCPFAQKFELQPESDSQPAIDPTQLILHSIAAPWTPGRIYEYWRDSTNLESHFGLGYDGSLGQFLGTETRADANYAANRRPDGTGAISLESASNLQHTDPWTPEQIETLIRVGVWVHQQHGIPLRKCRSASDPGYGYHRLYPEWSLGGTACPGDARVAQFHDIVFPGIASRANGAPTPPEEEVPSLLNGSNPIDVQLAPSTWVPLALDTDGGAFLAGSTGAVSAVATLYFATDTPADTKIQGVFYLTDADGSNESAYVVTDHRGGGGHQFVHAAPVPVGKLLWFRVRAVPADGTSSTLLLHRDLKGHYFA